MLFDEMNLLPALLSSVKEFGYEEPTPIQRETIPLVLQGRDVLGCAQTGTGKTAAFALPILQRLWQQGLPSSVGKRPIRALVLTPTRELALQIDENFRAYGRKLPFRFCVVFGGVNQKPQVEQLKRGVDVLVATPGRLNDLIGQGYIQLDKLEIFVLDEADRMLDMGFIHDVRRVIAKLPEERQTLFFSATMPGEVESLALSILHDPAAVKVDPVSSTVDAIEQCLYMVDKANKKLLLASILRQPEVESALVFSRTKHGADRVVRELGKEGISAKAIHGDKSQSARQEALSQFKNGNIGVLVATDIAARGIDIAGLSHVINYDIPNEPEAYVHRIGRTGRAGMEGIAISFCCVDELKELKAIEKLIGFTIPRKESQWPMEVFTPTVKQPRQPRNAESKATLQKPAAARSGSASRPAAAKPAAPGRTMAAPKPASAKPAAQRTVSSAKPAAQRAVSPAKPAQSRFAAQAARSAAKSATAHPAARFGPQSQASSQSAQSTQSSPSPSRSNRSRWHSRRSSTPQG